MTRKIKPVVDQQCEPISRNYRAVLAMILNALDRDAADGKAVRGEMAAELRCAIRATARQPGVTALVEALEDGFPLLSDEGLDEVEHHCEWAIQQERKRLHSILAAHRKQGGVV